MLYQNIEKDILFEMIITFNIENVYLQRYK